MYPLNSRLSDVIFNLASFLCYYGNFQGSLVAGDALWRGRSLMGGRIVEGTLCGGKLCRGSQILPDSMERNLLSANRQIPIQ